MALNMISMNLQCCEDENMGTDRPPSSSCAICVYYRMFWSMFYVLCMLRMGKIQTGRNFVVFLSIGEVAQAHRLKRRRQNRRRITKKQKYSMDLLHFYINISRYSQNRSHSFIWLVWCKILSIFLGPHALSSGLSLVNMCSCVCLCLVVYITYRVWYMGLGSKS